MITWNTYFVVGSLLRRIVDVRMPSTIAVKVADYVDKFDEVRKPFVEWQEAVLFKAAETDRDFLFVEKLDEKTEIPEFKFSEIPVEFTPAEVVLLRSANLW